MSRTPEQLEVLTQLVSDFEDRIIAAGLSRLDLIDIGITLLVMVIEQAPPHLRDELHVFTVRKLENMLDAKLGDHHAH